MRNRPIVLTEQVIENVRPVLTTLGAGTTLYGAALSGGACAVTASSVGASCAGLGAQIFEACRPTSVDIWGKSASVPVAQVTETVDAQAATSPMPDKPQKDDCLPELDDDQLSPEEMRAEWNRIRGSFRTKEAAEDGANYSKSNITPMKDGLAPFGIDGNPMEVHHIRPISVGGINSPDNLKIMTQTDHRLGDNYKLNHKTNVPDPC